MEKKLCWRQRSANEKRSSTLTSTPRVRFAGWIIFFAKHLAKLPLSRMSSVEIISTSDHFVQIKVRLHLVYGNRAGAGEPKAKGQWTILQTSLCREYASLCCDIEASAGTPLVRCKKSWRLTLENVFWHAYPAVDRSEFHPHDLLSSDVIRMR